MTKKTRLLRWRPLRLGICLALILVCDPSPSQPLYAGEPAPATQQDIDELKKQLSLIKTSPMPTPPQPTRIDGRIIAVAVANRTAHELTSFIGARKDLRVIAISDLLNCLDDPQPSVRARPFPQRWAVVKLSS